MKKISIILCALISLALLTCKNAYSAQSGIYTSNEYTQNQIVKKAQSDIIYFVVDYSGSMSSWANLIRSTMDKILPQIAPNTQVGLRVFGPTKTISRMIQVTKKNETIYTQSKEILSGCSATYQMVAPGYNNSKTITSSLSSLRISGVTPITTSLDETIKTDFSPYPMSLKKKIILITDGADNCSGDPCQNNSLMNLIKSRNDISIDVIMLGSTTELACLANESGGKHYNITSKKDFDNTFQTVTEVKPPQPQQTQQTQQTQTNSSNSQYNYEFLSD